MFALLEGHKDALTALAEAEAEYLARLICPQCHHDQIEKRVRVENPFIAGQPLVQWDGSCTTCGCLFDPHTLLIKNAGIILV